MLAVLIQIHLLVRRGDKDDRIPTDERRAELALDLIVLSLFSIIQDDVDVDVECFELTDVLSAVFEFYDDPFVPGPVQCVQWSCFHANTPWSRGTEVYF